jgi:hypothetical protein
MAASRAAYMVEKAIGHDDSAILKQDVSNYEAQLGDSMNKMKALTWQGKGKVEVGKSRLHCATKDLRHIVEVNKPEILEDGDAILKVTGSTVCGSDLHLLSGNISSLPSNQD